MMRGGFMQKSCELIQDQLIDFLDDEKRGSPLIRAHVKECSDCRNTLQSYQDVRTLYQSLPDREPPFELADRILSRVSEGAPPRVGVMVWISRFWLHPATVAAFVFTL